MRLPGCVCFLQRCVPSLPSEALQPISAACPTFSAHLESPGEIFQSNDALTNRIRISGAGRRRQLSLKPPLI